MKTRKFLAPILMALIVVLPTLVVLPAASAQDRVVVAPTVDWVPQPNMLQYVYLRYMNLTSTGEGPGAPNCSGANQQPPFLSVFAFKAATPSVTDRDCSYSSSDVAGTVPNSVSFQWREPFRASWNATSNDSLIYVHRGSVPDDVTVQVTLRTADVLVAQGAITGDSDLSSFEVKLLPISPDVNRREFRRGETMVLTLAGSTPPFGGISGAPGSAPRWTVRESALDGSRLEIRAADAVKAATWAADEAGVVRDLFRPLLPGTSPDARIVGVFAVQSAFGQSDARAGPAPRFTILRGGQPVSLGEERGGEIVATYNTTLSADDGGRAVWAFGAPNWQYHGFPGGEYEFRVDKPYHQGSSIRYGSNTTIYIASQSVQIRPFDDSDPLTLPAPLESQSHDLSPGGSTTYLFLVNNTGSVTDTFRMETAFISGNPPTGWSATVGGPNILNGEVRLAPGEEKLVTLAIRAPFGAPIDSSAIHQLRAVSRVDPLVTAQPVTVVSTVTNTIRNEVEVIIFNPTERVEPGTARQFPVYVWNRGTRPANFTLEISETTRAGWDVNLLLGSLGVKQITVSNVGPGDIARVEMRAFGAVGAEVENTVGLVATSMDVGGVSIDRRLRLVLIPAADIRLQIFDRIGAIGHFTEVHGSPTFCTSSLGCRDDGVNGAWFRLWLTNTGKSADTFDLSVDSVEWATGTARFGAPCEDTIYLPHATDDENFGFFTRDAAGRPTLRKAVSLAPAETAEVYLWRSSDLNADTCTSSNFLRFVVQARGRDTGAIARAGATIVAEQNEPNARVGVNAVAIEGVARKPGYSGDRPIVDISQVGRRTYEGGIGVGENRSMFVRVTIGSSYNNAPARVSLAGVNLEAGWNVTMRPANGVTDETQNPYRTTLTLNNILNERREAWADHEIELRIRAPSPENGTGFAGEKDEFTVHVDVPGTSVRDALEVRAVITRRSNVVLSADTTRVLAHPGTPGVFLLYVANDGSSPAPVVLRARMNPNATVNPNQWVVEPAEQSLSLEAFRNRTVALLATPPAGASPGTTGEVDVTVEFPPDPLLPTITTVVPLTLNVEVTPLGSLRLESNQRETTIAPGRFANFTMTLRNTGGVPLQYRITGTPIPGWNQTLSPTEAVIEAGATRLIPYVLEAPTNVVENARFASVVRVVEVNNDGNFDTAPIIVNILGGKAIASVSVPSTSKTVPRGSFQSFEVQVRNVGSASGRIPLDVRTNDAGWTAWVANERGENITGITLGPNELRNVNVTVLAPRNVPEGARVGIELTAYAPDYTASSKAALQAMIQDYGVDISAVPARLDAVPGVPVEFALRVANLGNANDTLNISAHLVDLPEWTVTLSQDRVSLEAGTETEVRATVRPPTSPLPTPRSYSFQFFTGTVGGAALNQHKNDSVIAIVSVLNYRSLDADADGFLEVAVDADKRPGNGFESFREISSEGVQSVAVATAFLNGKANYFLDVPTDRPYDGVADVWFDPEAVYAYRIAHPVDVNGDATPDYLIDSDRDAKIDLAYDTVTQRWWTVVEVKVFGDDRVQYLIDITGNGRPDRYYDPETAYVTRTQGMPDRGPDLLGIDTTNDGRVNKVYDTKTGSVSDAKVRNFADFVADFWYFFAGFALLLFVSIGLIVRRYRHRE